MNKRIILSFLSILTTLSLVSGATFAYFNDTEDSAGNVIAAGTLVFGSPVDNFYDISNIAPGDTVTGDEAGAEEGVAAGYDYNIGNGGSIDADHVEITVANTVTDVGSDADPDMDAKLTITSLKYKPRGGSAIDIKSILEDVDNAGDNSVTAGDVGAYRIRTEGGQTFATFLDGGTLTLNSWENAPSALEIQDNPAVGGVPEGLADGTNADFDLDLEFDSDADNDYQGDSVETVVTFTLNQDDSQ